MNQHDGMKKRRKQGAIGRSWRRWTKRTPKFDMAALVELYGPGNAGGADESAGGADESVDKARSRGT